MSPTVSLSKVLDRTLDYPDQSLRKIAPRTDIPQDYLEP
jgi:hypothetical protein